MQRLDKILAHKTAPKVPEWPSYGNFCKVSQTRISWKSAKGVQGKIFKNRPNSSHRLKGLKALWHKWHYPLIRMQLTCKDWRGFWRRSGSKTARTAKLWLFLQRHPKLAFSEKVQTGDQSMFFKNRTKSSLRFKGLRALWRKWHYPLISILLKCKNWRRFWRRRRLQNCPNGEVMAIFARSPKTRILWKSAKGGPREFFQKSPKK